MLKLFRQKGVAKTVLWIVSGIIILSFVLGASISTFSKNEDLTKTAGKIFKKRISLKNFHDEYLNVRDQAILTYGSNADQILPYLNLEQETWTRLMLLHEAKQKDIKATNAEVVHFIQSMPAFQRDGRFDEKYYELILKNIFKRSPRLFEESMRGQLSIIKMFQALSQHIVIKSEDIEQAFLERYKKIQLSYLSFNTQTSEKEITLTAEDIKQYYEENIVDFNDQTLEQATPIIETTLKNIKSYALTQEKARQAHEQITQTISQQLSFKQAVEKLKLSMITTELFSLQEPPAFLNENSSLLKDIRFLNKEKPLSPVLQTSTGFIIAFLNDEKAPDLTALNDLIKEELSKTLHEERRMAIMNDFINDVRARSQWEDFLSKEKK